MSQFNATFWIHFVGYSHNNFHEDVHVISVLECVPGASSCNNVLCKRNHWRNQQFYFDLSPGDDLGPPDLVDLRPGLDPGLFGEDCHVHTKLRKEAGDNSIDIWNLRWNLGTRLGSTRALQIQTCVKTPNMIRDRFGDFPKCLFNRPPEHHAAHG